MIEYVKIENNQLEYAPRDKDGVSNWILDEQAVLAEGYLPYEPTEYPTDGKRYNTDYIEKNGVITTVYTEIPYTYEEVVALRIQYRQQIIDDKTLARMRKQANGTWTEDDETAYLALDAEVTAFIEENYPYPASTEPAKGSDNTVVELYSMEI